MSVKIARILCLIGLLCLVPFPARAQNITTVSATIVDPNGLPYSGASVQAQLVPTGITPTLNGQQVASFTRATADVTGTFNMNLASNAIILPGGTQWQFTVNISPGIPPPAGTGPQSFVVTLTISGATQNISSNLNAVAPALTNFAGSPNAAPAQGHITVAKACTNPLALNVTCFQVADDWRIVIDATWSAQANVQITTGGTDPPFLSSGNVYPATCSSPSPTCDIGKTAFGTANCNAISPQQCFTSIPQGTITSITNAHLATLTSTASTASSNGSGIRYFAWGTIDTTALQNATDAAFTSTSPTDVQLPCGNMGFDNVLFNAVRVTRSLYPVGFKGCTGNGSTTLIPLPNFTCGNSVVCFINLTYNPGQSTFPFWSDAAENINFFGLGLDVPGGAGFTGGSHIFFHGAPSTTFRNVTGIGYLWDRASGNVDFGFECIGCNSNGTAAFVFGNRPCHFQGALSGEAGLVQGGYCGGSAYTTLIVDGSATTNAVLVTQGVSLDTPIQNDGTVLSATTDVPSGATLFWTDYHSTDQGCGFFSGGTTVFDGTYLHPISGACSSALTVNNAAATLTLKSANYTPAGFSWLALSAGTVLDGCNNTGTYTGTNAPTITGGTLTPCASEPSVGGRCLLTSAAGPLACGNAAGGKVAIPTTTATYTINTTSVQSGSTITITPTTDNTGIPGAPACVLPTLTADPSISATVAGTSFTIAETSTTGITCYNWSIR